LIREDYIYNLGHLFSTLVEENNLKIAINYPEGNSYSFEDLHQLSNKYRSFFKEQGLKKGDVVAILNQKSINAFALMIAALKTGVIYTNLDPFSPIDRLNKMLDRCQPKLLIIDDLNQPAEAITYTTTTYSVFKLSGIEVSNYSKVELTEEFNPNVVGNDPAYIMFTSGSTGFPKGAVMSHDNLINLIKWAKTTFEIKTNDKFTGVNPIYFDNSVFDFYASIFNLAEYVPFSTEQVKDPKRLVDLIDKANCTNWFSVPSMLIYLMATKVLTTDKFKSIKTIAFGGEGFSKQQLLKLYNNFNEKAKIVNVYGPTECTCICSSYLISEHDFKDMNSFAPLGNIAPNFDYYIDPTKKDNINEGELCLLGPNVGIGYYNDPDRTTAAFVPHPSKKYSSTMYKTGDLVFLGHDGLLHIKGRIDNQIKHMGYRIELEEVESGMNRVSEIKESAALYKKLKNGMGYIIGFVASNSEIDVQQFKNELKSFLPEYMIPKEVRQLDVLPKNQNGKVDRVILKELI
jgi:D-alanine--poly(phosphoribitol) ligase subunit 1